MNHLRGEWEAAVFVGVLVGVFQSGPNLTRIGSLSHEFEHVTSVRELSDGRVLVADLKDRRVVVGDWKSGSVSLVGRRGAGPAEYHSPGQLIALEGDTSLLVDYSDRRILRMVGDAFIDAPSLEVGLRLTRHGAPIRGTLGNRRALVLAPLARPIKGHLPPAMQLVGLTDSTFVVLTEFAVANEDTIARIGGRYRETAEITRATAQGPMTFILDNPFAVEDQAWLTRDGWVAVAYHAPYRVDWREPSGTWIRGTALPYDAPSATIREKRFSLSRARATIPGGPIDPSVFRSWPTQVPPFEPDALFPLETGQIAVVRRPISTSTSLEVDVINRRGQREWVGRLPLECRIVGFGRDVVFAVSKDEDGIETLHRFRMP